MRKRACLYSSFCDYNVSRPKLDSRFIRLSGTLRRNSNISPCRFYILECHIRLISIHIWKKKPSKNKRFITRNSTSNDTQTLSAIAENLFLTSPRFQKNLCRQRLNNVTNLVSFGLLPMVFLNWVIGLVTR